MPPAVDTKTAQKLPDAFHFGLMAAAQALANAAGSLEKLSKSDGALTAMARTARAEYRVRRKRDEVFAAEPGLFGEPAWDILLDLYERELRGERTCVSSASIASHSPATTALRYLDTLTRLGLVYREPDAADRRRFFLRLTPKGMERMTSVFGENLRG